jgi:hypothetical protein
MRTPPEIDLFTPSSFPRAVTAGVVGRSPAARDGRGLSFTPGKATPEADARESRAVLASRLGVSIPDLVFARQVHGARVVPIVRGAPAGEADGMVTDETGLVLCLSIADCCAILVCDPARGTVGAFHAGWRGARDGVAAAGLSAMRDCFGTRPRDLLVYLSPRASADRYEVGEEVARLFPASVRRAQGGEPRWNLDLSAEISRQLVASGVQESSIEISPICSIGDARCHSHRRDGAASGRMVAFIARTAV